MNQKKPFDQRFDEGLAYARAAFWHTFSTYFHESTSGDLAPDACQEFDEATERAASRWIDANCQHVRYALGSYVRYTSASCEGEAKDALAVVVQGGVECLDPETLARLDKAGISPFCAWCAIDWVEPVEHYTDAQLLLVIAEGIKLDQTHRLILRHRMDGKSDPMATAIEGLHHKLFGEF